MAGIVGVTTGLQIATIVQQRNALKSMSVSGGSSSSSSSSNIGVREVAEFAEGGFTPKATSDTTPVGIVHANEWVASAAMVRANPVLFQNLDNLRKNNFANRHPRLSGYADGGFTTTTVEATTQSNSDILNVLNQIVTILTQGIFVKAYVLLQDIKKNQEKLEKHSKYTSR